MRLADEREAVWRNTKLGAARQTGAALVSLFREERPKERGTTTPYRMPLAKLADRTGLDEGTCSKHLQQLAKYRTADDTPVLHIDTRDILRSVNQETGEVIGPHKEVWVGPGVESSAFGYILAALKPADAPKHGGKPDRNVCANHPIAGTIRRTTTTRKVTYECAECRTVLDTTTVPIGRSSEQFIPAPAPMQQDAFAPETGAPVTARPIQQDAGTMGNHMVSDLSGKMQHRSSFAEVDPPELWNPPPGWEDDRRRTYGQLYRREAAS